MTETCCKCHKEATYNSPRPLCDYHWAEWWTEGIMPKDKRLKELRQTLKEIEKKHGKQA